MQTVHPSPAAVKNVYMFLMLTPVEYLSRNLRNFTVSKAYEWDITFARSAERQAESMLLRRYLSRTIAETSYIGNLVSQMEFSERHTYRLPVTTKGNREYRRTSGAFLSVSDTKR
jgi:hypothetical protein